MDAIEHRCPLCSSARNRQVSRSGTHLRRCLRCGAAYNTAYRPLGYGDSYFLEDYRRQYGKTYEEDAGPIYGLAVSRLDHLFSAFTLPAPKAELRLLDIGCALGFFLKAARDRGVGSVEGLEISSYAARFCEKNLQIPVTTSSFDDAKLSGSFDIITAWYFIEHTVEPRRSLERIYGLLRPGGVLAFSAPSVFGPLYCFDRGRWEATHPGDHRVDFSPRAARMALKALGFSKISLRPAGVQPERIVTKESPLFPAFSPLYRTLSRWTGFSDTLEIFSQK